METAQAPLGIQAPLLGVQQGLHQPGLLLYRSLIAPLLQGRRFLPFVALPLPVPLAQTSQFLTASRRRSLNEWNGEFPAIEFNPIQPLLEEEAIAFEENQSINEIPSFQAAPPTLNQIENQAFNQSELTDAIDVDPPLPQATQRSQSKQQSKPVREAKPKAKAQKEKSGQTKARKTEVQSSQLVESSAHETVELNDTSIQNFQSNQLIQTWADKGDNTVERSDLLVQDSQLIESSDPEVVGSDDLDVENQQDVIAPFSQDSRSERVQLSNTDEINPFISQNSRSELVQPLDDETSSEPTFVPFDRTGDVAIPLDSASKVDVMREKCAQTRPQNSAISDLGTVNKASVNTTSEVIKVEEIATKSIAREWQHQSKPAPTKRRPFILKSDASPSPDKALLSPSVVRFPNLSSSEGESIQSPPDLGDLGGDTEARSATFIPESSNATDHVVQTSIANDHPAIAEAEDTTDYESDVIQEAPSNLADVQLSPNAELAGSPGQLDAPIAESDVHEEAAIDELDLQAEEAIEPDQYPITTENERASTRSRENVLPSRQNPLNQEVEPEVLLHESVGSTDAPKLPLLEARQEQKPLIELKTEPTSTSANQPSDNSIDVLEDSEVRGQSVALDTAVEHQIIEPSIEYTPGEDLSNSREIPIEPEAEESSTTDTPQTIDRFPANLKKNLEEPQSELDQAQLEQPPDIENEGDQIHQERLEQTRSDVENERDQIHQKDLNSQSIDLTATAIDHPTQADLDRSIKPSDLTTLETPFSLDPELPLLETSNALDRVEPPIGSEIYPVDEFQQISDAEIQPIEPLLDRQPTIPSDHELAALDQESSPETHQQVEAGFPFDQITEPIHGYAVGGQVKTTPPSQGAIAPSDIVPAMLTPGEFVINARDAQKHLPLLHHLNQGGDMESAPIPTVQSDISINRVVDELAIAGDDPSSEPAVSIARKPATIQRQSRRRSPPDSTLFRSAIPLSQIQRQALSDFTPLESSIIDQPHAEPTRSYASPSLIFRSAVPPSGSSSAPLPDEWNSIDELLGGSGDRVQSFSDWNSSDFPEIVSPMQTIVRRQAVQGFADGGEVTAPSSTEASGATSAVSETIAAPTDSDTQADASGAIESLAHEIYQRLRQRLEIERERQGTYSGRLPW